MAYHVREGVYGEVRVDGLSVIVVVTGMQQVGLPVGQHDSSPLGAVQHSSPPAQQFPLQNAG
jgi:hypothetical protein